MDVGLNNDRSHLAHGVEEETETSGLRDVREPQLLKYVSDKEYWKSRVREMKQP